MSWLLKRPSLKDYIPNEMKIHLNIISLKYSNSHFDLSKKLCDEGISVRVGISDTHSPPYKYTKTKFSTRDNYESNILVWNFPMEFELLGGSHNKMLYFEFQRLKRNQVIEQAFELVPNLLFENIPQQWKIDYGFTKPVDPLSLRQPEFMQIDEPYKEIMRLTDIGWFKFSYRFTAN